MLLCKMNYIVNRKIVQVMKTIEFILQNSFK